MNVQHDGFPTTLNYETIEILGLDQEPTTVNVDGAQWLAGDMDYDSTNKVGTKFWPFLSLYFTVIKRGWMNLHWHVKQLPENIVQFLIILNIVIFFFFKWWAQKGPISTISQSSIQCF